MASNTTSFLKARYAEVEQKIQSACDRVGRNRNEVTLVAVTKTISAEATALLPSLGIIDLGESRPQVLWEKAEALPDNVRWHMIGHLQRNKIDRTLPLVSRIHSVDSMRLLEALDKEATKLSRPVPIFLEINASREPQKHGFAPEELPQLLPKLEEVNGVHVEGLMTMAAFEEDVEKCRPTFASLRELRDRFSQEMPNPHSLHHLSMGMSNDYEVAIEEGSTFIRLGSVLFEGFPEQ